MTALESCGFMTYQSLKVIRNETRMSQLTPRILNSRIRKTLSAPTSVEGFPNGTADFCKLHRSGLGFSKALLA